jgi:hypothetical protein
VLEQQRRARRGGTGALLASSFPVCRGGLALRLRRPEERPQLGEPRRSSLDPLGVVRDYSVGVLGAGDDELTLDVTREPRQARRPCRWIAEPNDVVGRDKGRCERPTLFGEVRRRAREPLRLTQRPLRCRGPGATEDDVGVEDPVTRTFGPLGVRGGFPRLKGLISLAERLSAQPERKRQRAARIRLAQ